MQNFQKIPSIQTFSKISIILNFSSYDQYLINVQNIMNIYSIYGNSIQFNKNFKKIRIEPNLSEFVEFGSLEFESNRLIRYLHKLKFLGCFPCYAGCKHPINFANLLACLLRKHKFVENRYAKLFLKAY